MKTPPANHFTLPAWVTVHNAELAGAALVIILLAFAVLRLAGGSKAPPPAPAPKKSGGGGKLLLAVAAAIGGLFLWGHYIAPAVVTGAKAAPGPSPSPSPTPTVTRTLAPHPVTHITLPHLTGTDLVWIFVIAAVVAIVLLGPVLRKKGD